MARRIRYPQGTTVIIGRRHSIRWRLLLIQVFVSELHALLQKLPSVRMMDTPECTQTCTRMAKSFPY